MHGVSPPPPALPAKDTPIVWLDVREGNPMYENLYSDHRIWMERVCMQQVIGSQSGAGGQLPAGPKTTYYSTTYY